MSSPSLLSGQGALARLPVPDMHATLSKLLRTLEPVAGDDKAALARTREAAEDFAKTVGPRLQRLLEERDNKEEISWLARWWDEIAYLRYRESVVINVSFFMVFTEPPPPHTSLVKRAATLTRALLEYKHMVDTGTLTPDPQPADQLPHTRVFGACRIPLPECDGQFRVPNPALSGHVIVAYRDFFWRVEARGSSVGQLERVFAEIVAGDRRGDGVGVLTAGHRDRWAVLHARLEELGNRETLEAIRTSGFLVCLDAEWSPRSLDEICAGVLHATPSTGANRWFDKPVQLIIGAGGQAVGINGEHSPVDGGTISRITDWICERERALLMSPLPEPHQAQPLRAIPLPWKIDANMRKEIAKERVELTKAISGLELRQLRFKGYGKRAVTRLRVSPDAWAQIAMHVAYFRLHGRLATTYESAATLRYLGGRTETGRTLSVEMAAFVRALCSSRDSKGESKANLDELLRAAATAHVKYMREATHGHGVDRHLLAWRLLAKEHNVTHPLLDDPLVARSSHWLLSTSQLPVQHVCIGFGPVVPDGYGICYQVHDDAFHFSVSRFNADPHTNATAMVGALKEVLEEMIHLVITPASL